MPKILKTLKEGVYYGEPVSFILSEMVNEV